MALPLPMVPCKVRAIGLGGTTGGSPVWGANASPIKILRGRWGLGLRWPLFDDATQQSTYTWRKRLGGLIAEAGGEGGVGGGTVHLFGAVNGTPKNKK
jgi:hypothetical protein